MRRGLFTGILFVSLISRPRLIWLVCVRDDSHGHTRFIYWHDSTKSGAKKSTFRGTGEVGGKHHPEAFSRV